MKLPPFEYHQPETVEETTALLAEHGEEAKMLAGGQSLMPLMAFRMVRPSHLIDINRVEGLDDLSIDGDVLTMGALTRHRSVERLDSLAHRCDVIRDAVRHIGHVAIRNRGTVGGSIAHADPAAEWPLLALILDGRFEVASPRGSRTIRAADMFVSYLETSMATDEVLTRLDFRLPASDAGSAFVEVARRHGDFAMGGAGAVLHIVDGAVVNARVGVLAAGLTAIRSAESEAVLVGSEATDAVIEAASRVIDTIISPLEDVHAPEDYKRQLAYVTTRRALTLARDRALRGVT